MSVSRQCSRAACPRPAARTLTYVYSDSTVVLGPLATYAEPHAYDLCDDHADRLTAPRGWDVVRLAAEIAESHHERWDGTGYPAGLRGQNIPETARLFTIVDVYDALTNARPYKPAWPRESALAELRAQAGKQFDPQYVDAFLRMLAEQDDAQLVRR